MFKNSLSKQPVPALLVIVLSSLLCLCLTATTACSMEPLEGDIAKALRRVVKCEKVEVKTKGEDSKRGRLQSLLIRFMAMSKKVLPADYVTVQYSNPDIDLNTLKRANTFKVNASSNFKIGMLVSEQTVRSEIEKSVKRLNLRYDKLLIKFTPPYIEVEFDIPAGAVPLKERKLLEKFVRNKRFAGYAAFRLEIKGNRLIAAPDKVILNHFLMPAPLVAELKKRINPVYQLQRIRPFDYNLVKVDIMKQHVYLSN